MTFIDHKCHLLFNSITNPVIKNIVSSPLSIAHCPLSFGSLHQILD